MNFSKFLECNEFQYDFVKYSYCEITGMSTFDPDFFEVVDDEFVLELMRFFETTHELSINEIARDPISYEIISPNTPILEYFDPEIMFIELIEQFYGHTLD